ncbi:hypothetical protein UCDDS831_g00928 [Diplodia seriata]|nr:hypothetical protein UCDDS831_g00928 [Diplodia seriata]
MSPPDNTVSLSYSSLMRDQMASEPEAGMENIQIDEEWIERNGAFACIWALTYKLPTKEAEEMAQAMMSPHTYTKRG